MAAETKEDIQIPVAILENCDDAGAIEASLIENVARKGVDEMTEYEAYPGSSVNGGSR